MILDFLIFAASFFIVIKSASWATRYAGLVAERFHLSKYVVGFLVVAIISVLPETIISTNAALQGIPTFGLGTLFGSNVADLTIVFAIIILLTGHGMKVESKILKDNRVYPLLLLLPLFLGLDGSYSRLEGI